MNPLPNGKNKLQTEDCSRRTYTDEYLPPATRQQGHQLVFLNHQRLSGEHDLGAKESIQLWSTD
jgi:hypothetical protein